MARRGRNDRVKQAARRRRIQGAALSGGALVAGQLAGIPPARADTLTVTNLLDAGTGSLRQAIADSNLTPLVDDTIDFLPSLSGTVYLTSGALVITDDVVIGGPFNSFLTGVTVHGNYGGRVFEVYSPDSLIDVTISGLGVRGGSTAGDGGGIWVQDENLTLENMFIFENHSGGDGGGVYFGGPDQSVGQLTITDSGVVANGAADDGGGLAVQDAASMTITASGFDRNQAGDAGGGITIESLLSLSLGSLSSIVDSTITGNTGGEGGGLSIYQAQGGFTVERTTVSENTAVNESGGGIFVVQADSLVTIVESTISGNTATNTGRGGGLALYFDSATSPDVSIQHSTITDNAAYGGGGVWARSTFSRIELDHTIVAGNTGTSFGPDLSGEFNDAWSLIGNTSGPTLHPVGGTQNLLNVDPLLGPLGDHGGLTPTHLPAGISPALNAGDPTFAAPPATDQRDMPRKLDTRIDIGSVELYPSLPGRVASSTGWSLQDALLPASSTTSATITNFSLGTTPLVPLTGDWDGDGDKTPGYVKGGTFFLFNGFTAGAATLPVTPFAFGDNRGFPVAGDFDDDGADDVAVFRNGLWQVKFSGGGTTTYTLGSGSWPATVPVAGDWDGGEGGDGIGVYQAGTWTLRDDVTVTNEDYSFFYRPGTAGYPVVGDWDGDGDETVGVKLPTGSQWQVRNTNNAGAPDYQFNFGAANQLPVVWQLAENPVPDPFDFPFPIP